MGTVVVLVLLFVLAGVIWVTFSGRYGTLQSNPLGTFVHQNQAEREAESIIATPLGEREAQSRIDRLTILRADINDTSVVTRIDAAIEKFKPIAQEDLQAAMLEATAAESISKNPPEREYRPLRARDITSAVFSECNPGAIVNWLTYNFGATENNEQIYVGFEYSKVNASGVREQRKYEVWWKYSLERVLAQRDTFLNYRD